jgi:hypothetical protein
MQNWWGVPREDTYKVSPRCGLGESSGGTSASGKLMPVPNASRSKDEDALCRNALCGSGSGGGRDLSTREWPWPSFNFAFAAALDFLLLLSIKDSWQLIQNMPCGVRAYRRFSILRLQFLQRKQAAQNAWSPVRIARSSILLPHALHEYVQSLHMSESSPRRRRFASESTKTPQVLHRKQLRCHRFPAIIGK